MKSIAVALFLASLCSIPNATFAQDQKNDPDRSVVYKTINGVELKLHCFEPQGLQPSDQRPAIVFFFGGGWNGGQPKQFYQQARYFADRGVVAMSADYRVKSRNKTTPFECVKDGKSAIRWVRQHAKELGIDPNRIVASGGSAGGHVAACTGIIKGLEEVGEDVSVSSVPNAMILFNPVLDTTKKGYGLKAVGPSRQTEISPCHHVGAGIVPTILFHGTADTTVPFENAQRFARLMKQAGNTCQLEAFDGEGHGFFNGSLFRPKAKDFTAYKRCVESSAAFLKSLGYLGAAAPTKKKTRRVMEAVTDAPGLPRVLLIGDSISIGYTLPTRDKLKGVANVHRPLTNCGPTTKGVAEIDKWLGDKKWDVIHFNWGLHDLKYMGPNNENLADPNVDTSHQQVPPAQYEANLRRLVLRLEQTGGKLIWRNTTPVPEGCKGRVVGDSAKYNAIAAKVMKKHGIETQDMFAFCQQHPELQLPKNVHFTGKGSAQLADQVVKSISTALKAISQ